MTIAFGILVFVLGFGLRYFINRRAFNRRNAAGVEIFNSYESATGNRFIEGIGRILGLLIMLGGLFIILKGYFGHH